MRRRVDPLGELLRRSGALDDDAVVDVLDQQRHTLPFASLCYVLGHADEETLVRVLSRQLGAPGVVVDRCVIPLRVFEGISRETLLRENVLPILEDERRLFVAVEDPGPIQEVLRELEFVTGKAITPHVALRVTLARALRVCLRRLDAGDSLYAGPAADRGAAGPEGALAAVSEFDDMPADEQEAEAHHAVYLDVTSEVHADDLVMIDTVDEPRTAELAEGSQNRALDPDEPISVTQPQAAAPPFAEQEATDEAERHDIEVIDLDDGEGVSPPRSADPEAHPRVLIVDDDYATRHLLVRELPPAGYHSMTAQTGGEAVERIKNDPPDAIIIDVMLPEIDGFQVCRAVKQSRRYRHIPVVLMSAVIDSGPVTGEVLRRYGADAYFEKPLNVDRLKARIRELLEGGAGRPPARKDGDGFERALALYREGEIDQAVEVLRSGIAEDPLSAKHHFVLANLLQKKSLIYEAIDEYEATIDLKPDYFPALTRLAYLYYKQGFAAKAIETWRRSLPLCPDPALRQNIEVFMRKLIAEMQRDLG